MNLNEKIDAAENFIRQVLGEFRHPAVLWSSGKDSMVLLHLIRRVTKTLPVVFHREPWFPERYAFADSVIREWSLTVFDWPPERASLCHSRGHFSIFEFYQLAPGKHTGLPQDCYEPADPTQPMLCGLRDVLGRPKGQFTAPWDCFFHGHKSSDVDPLLGQIPLTVDLKLNTGAPAAAFVLRDWSDADIWEYIATQNVPYQATRYEQKPDGTWGEHADRQLNPDYLAACTRCMDRRNPATVFCPKLQRQINNIAHELPHQEMTQPTHCGKEDL
jgi:hypothetical protein